MNLSKIKDAVREIAQWLKDIHVTRQNVDRLCDGVSALGDEFVTMERRLLRMELALDMVLKQQGMGGLGALPEAPPLPRRSR